MLRYSSFTASFQMNILGIQPEFKKNGEYPVVSDLDRFNVNSIAGNLATQSHWVELMQDRSICPSVWFTHSVDLSD